MNPEKIHLLEDIKQQTPCSLLDCIPLGYDSLLSFEYRHAQRYWQFKLLKCSGFYKITLMWYCYSDFLFYWLFFPFPLHFMLWLLLVFVCTCSVYAHMCVCVQGGVVCMLVQPPMLRGQRRITCILLYHFLLHSLETRFLTELIQLDKPARRSQQSFCLYLPQSWSFTRAVVWCGVERCVCVCACACIYPED